MVTVFATAPLTRHSPSKIKRRRMQHRTPLVTKGVA